MVLVCAACLSIALPSAAARTAGPPKAALKAIPSPAAPESGEPSLTVGPDGGVWLSWLEKRAAGGHALKLARLEGRRWSRPCTIAEGDSFFVNWADFPSVVALGDGTLAAHWLWKSGRDVYAYDVRVAFSRDAGRTWSAPVIPHRDGTATEHGFVSLLPAGDGARAMWLDGRNFAKPPGDTAAPAAGHGEHGMDAEMTLRSAVLHPNGRLSDEALLDPRVCDCCQTAAVTTPRGTLVAYRDRGADETRDMSLALLEDGRWSEPAPLHADGWKIPGCPVNGPALDAAGERVAAAWYTAAADTPRVWLAFSDDGGESFGAPVAVDGGDPLGRVDVVLLDDGAALVIWLETEGDDASVLLRRVARDGTMLLPVTVTRTSSARVSGFPRMVRSGKRLIFAWTDPRKPAQVRVAEAKL